MRRWGRGRRVVESRFGVNVPDGVQSAEVSRGFSLGCAGLSKPASCRVTLHRRRNESGVSVHRRKTEEGNRKQVKALSALLCAGPVFLIPLLPLISRDVAIWPQS